MGRKISRTEKYDHRKVEKHWQKVWDGSGLHTPDLSKHSNKFYNLWMFPYPSAEGLHAGHAFASTGSDVYGRFMRMNEKNVFQPIGYDSFGIHSENFAIRINDHPKNMIDRTTKNYERQMRSLGHGYDWSKTVTTSDIDYYRWTQWVFVEMFKAGLAYRKKAKVNWCPSCKTVISDEQVVTPTQAGKDPKDEKGKVLKVEEGMQVCERCGYIVQQKELEQWMFRITDYADKLLDGLEKIDWPERIKTAQRNWIGKSVGAEVNFKLKRGNCLIKVFTTRPDTLFGATFMVVAPEYAGKYLMDLIPPEKRESVDKYIERSLKRSYIDRIANKEKTGIDTGLVAVNPVNNREIPVYVADYVLFDYGTGAIMAVPAHDERDFAFAKKFDLPVVKVIDQKSETHALLVKGSLKEDFEDAVKKNGWYLTNYLEWGYGVVVTKADDEKLIDMIQKYLKEEAWYAHTDGSSNVVIFKNKIFDIYTENDNAKNYARNLKIPEEQIDWDDKNNYLFCHDKPGKIVGSGNWNGMKHPEDFEKILSDVEKYGWGVRRSQYHLRDWLISRQRYWGPPIPMIYCSNCKSKGKGWFNTLSGKLSEPQKQVRASHSAKSERGDKSDLDSLSDLSKGKLSHNDQSDWDPAGWYPDENLPVELPQITDYKPEGTGRGPLANHPEFYKTTCPECGSEATRETDVSDTFLDSAWYFLRYPSANISSKYEYRNSKQFNNSSKTNVTKKIFTDNKLSGLKHSDLEFVSDLEIRNSVLPWSPEVTRQWLPVDLYFGGAEHAVLHLMYARFVTMVMNDLGYINFDEPFPRFFAHGLMIKDGAKMSKSRGNVVNPDEYIEKFGADTLRLYLMFMGPMDGYPDFRDTGIEGMRRFVEKVWGLFTTYNIQHTTYNKKIDIKMHQTIKKVTEDIQQFKYNTAIAAIMEFVNSLREFTQQTSNNILQNAKQFPISNEIPNSKKIPKSIFTNQKINEKWQIKNGKCAEWEEALRALALLIAPFAPHLAEEVWQKLNGQMVKLSNGRNTKQQFSNLTIKQFCSVHIHPWPKHDSEMVKEEMVTIPVQVNGKLRDTIEIEAEKAGDREFVIELAKKKEKVQKWLLGGEIKKEIYIEGKLLSFVV